MLTVAPLARRPQPDTTTAPTPRGEGCAALALTYRSCFNLHPGISGEVPQASYPTYTSDLRLNG